MNRKHIAQIFVRYALAITFLSAVADRFGLWGAPGQANIAWGNFANFLQYTGVLTPWAPKALVPFLGGAATTLEIIFALALLIGYKAKWAALGSALLLLIFALSMAATTGLKSPLDYSVFTASAAAFLLFAMAE